VVNGRLRCLGSTQRLKNRFGNGFEVNIKTMTPSDEEMTSLLEAIHERTAIIAPTAGQQTNQRNRRPQNHQQVPQEEMDVLDTTRFLQQQFLEIMTILGQPDRIQQMTEFGSGALIHEAIVSERSVTARLFLSWWISEDLFARLQVFMNEEFGEERTILLERSSGTSCRFRIRKLEEGENDPNNSEVIPIAKAVPESKDSGSFNNPLSEIFAKIEKKKEYLHVQEYSVCQTTLEQIFNQFAGQSDNPEVAMIQQQQRPSSAMMVPGSVRGPSEKGVEMSKL
jgi:ATP-binding cassette subfamily A (ABC1) protein 3